MLEYSATFVAFHWPEIVVRTDVLPSPLPLTVGCCAVSFLPTASEEDQPLTDPRPLQRTTDYIAIRGVPDPLSFQLRKWTRPSSDELRSIVETICQICNPRFLAALCPYIIVELVHDDDKVYATSSLPRKIAGFSSVYHHDAQSVFENTQLMGKERLITPNDSK